MNRRWIAVILAAALLTGCAPRPAAAEPDPAPPQPDSQERQAPYRFGIGYSSAGYTGVFTQWREQVLEQTQGNVELELYGENILGEGSDMIKAVQRGTLSIVASSTSVCTSVVPEAAVMDIPACFPGYSRPFQTYGGAFFEALNRCYNARGLELLHLRTGEAWVLSSAEPVVSLERLDGFRLRTSGSAYHNKLYEALGIHLVENVGLSGLSYLLDEDEVDGIETTYNILRTQQLLDAQPYALQGPWFVMSSSIVMNYDAFHALPQDYQDILKGTLKRLLDQRQQESSVQTAKGLTVLSFDEADQHRLRELAQPLLDEILSAVDPALVEALREENGEA